MNSKTYTIDTKRAISETLDGETIIINLETGSYYSMNPSATVLWTAIATGKSIPIDDPIIANFLQFLQTDGLINETESASDTLVADAADFPNPDMQKYTDMQEMLIADPIHDVEQSGWPDLKKE